jgi:hypothetical protein
VVNTTQPLVDHDGSFLQAAVAVCAVAATHVLELH